MALKPAPADVEAALAQPLSGMDAIIEYWAAVLRSEAGVDQWRQDSETLAKVREIATMWDYGDYGDDSVITEQEAATHSMVAIAALVRSSVPAEPDLKTASR